MNSATPPGPAVQADPEIRNDDFANAVGPASSVPLDNETLHMLGALHDTATFFIEGKDIRTLPAETIHLLTGAVLAARRKLRRNG